MKKKLKSFLKYFIGTTRFRNINFKQKIIRIYLIKFLEKINIHIFSDPYSLTYKDGKLDKNYKNIQSFIDRKEGTYFEIGALDGYFSSPTYVLSVKKNWKGVMVDGNKNFLDFIKLYRPKDEVIHAACTSFEKSNESRNCKFLDLHHSGEIYFDDDSIHGWAKEKVGELGDQIILKDTPLTNVSNIIDNSNIIQNHHIDLFVLDVEGHEREVLEGYDFTKIKTDYFLIESRTSKEFNNIKDFMATKGYKHLGQTSSTDYIYKKI